MMRECIEVRGQWMYPRDATRRMVGLIRSGLVRLEDFTVAEFPLEEVNEAVAHAAANTGPFKLTVVRP
jgi:alcohol dehydrogenase